jgi:hypothetical protein
MTDGITRSRHHHIERDTVTTTDRRQAAHTGMERTD